MSHLSCRLAAPTDADLLALSQALLRAPSLTPNDADCQNVIKQFLAPYGFAFVDLPFGDVGTHGARVQNLWAIKNAVPASAGNYPNTNLPLKPLFCFAGHTDVVPIGDQSSWRFAPFAATLAEGVLYGRGAADMKTAVAAFCVAAARFIVDNPQHRGSIALLITSDEEGDAINGTKQVVEWLRAQAITPDYCLVGEPSSGQYFGDTIKNGRRGSLSARLIVQGKQGHIAYPQLAKNPIHAAMPALAALIAEPWDAGDADFDPTSLQISNINAGTGATNMIAQTLICQMNWRFSPALSVDEIKTRTNDILTQHFAKNGMAFALEWTLSGLPFITPSGNGGNGGNGAEYESGNPIGDAFISALQAAIKAETGRHAQLSTSGGTSDGRFIATLGGQVLEFGVKNATIHQVDECVLWADVLKLARIYEQTLADLLR